MRHIWMLALLVACNANGGDDGFPVIPGGPSGPGEIVDARFPDGRFIDGGQTINGNVCLLFDLRSFTSCLESGAGGITVSLGTETAVTAVDGTFTIDTPLETGLWRVSGINVVPSVFAFGPLTSIPVVGIETFNDVLGANSIVLQANQGSIFLRIVRNGFPVVGATVTASPLAQFNTRFDGVTSLAFTELKTGPAGVAWIPGAQVGQNTVTVVPPTGPVATRIVPVEPGAITFATIALP